MDITATLAAIGARMQATQMSLAMAALKQSLSTEAQMAQLLARTLPPVPDPTSLLGQNIDTWV